MRLTRAALILLAVTAAPATTACGEIVCTLIGCADGFYVTLDGNVPSDYTIRLEASGQPPVEYAYDCPVSGCPHLWAIEGTTPELVEVVFFDAQGVEIARQTFQPQYEENRPNGGNCPPTCFQASETLTIT